MSTFRVTYDGNGNTGGRVPVDNNSYNAGDPVPVLPPKFPWPGINNQPANTNAGTLERANGFFAAWNSARNESGDWFYWPFDGSTLTITANTTLFAQWYISDGLTHGGNTGHYAFGYDAVLQNTSTNPTGLEPARTNQVIQNCESDYQIMANWFAGVSVQAPIRTFVGNGSDGAHTSDIIVVLPGNDGADTIRCLLVSEVTELFMVAQGKGWAHVPVDSSGAGSDNEESCGEGLSLFLTQQFAVQQGFANPFTAFTAATAKAWLNTALPTSNPRSTRFFDGPTGYDYGARADYVNSLRPYPGNGPGTGCSILFIYYLFRQLGFSISQIIAAAPGFTNGKLNATATLRGVYKNLTGDTGDPFPFFRLLLDTAFPPDQVAVVPGANPDNPYPIALMDFWVTKGTFGPDEVQDLVNANGGVWSKAFYLVVEGFSKNSFVSLGVTVSAFTGSFANLPGITFTQNPDIDFENAANPEAPQRIRISFDITVSAAAISLFPATGATTFELETFLIVDGAKVPASDAAAEFELVAGEDPYFTNIDPALNNVYYLSNDLRVFSAFSHHQSTPIVGGPSLPGTAAPVPASGYVYIQSLLAWLNQTYGDPSGPDPFHTVFPSQSKALTADSSVTPGQYNFVVARVRMRGVSGTASNVRVFFRLWSTETADADYRTDSSYPSVTDAANLPVAPLVGVDHQTIPFFASGDLSANTDYTAGGANTRDIQVGPNQDFVWTYFGCFLNLYDAGNLIDGMPVQALLNGTHHCIVAQIAYDGAPIPGGVSPVNSDKLAQRNVQITLSDNPGAPSTHRVPQTFDIRPSGIVNLVDAVPDELVIDWGAIPTGSLASIYWPQVAASDVIALANRFYSTHTLTIADANTIRVKVTGGVTYIPIPASAGPNYAGLFTVDLPTTVVTGQEFEVAVHRVSTRMVSQRRQANLRAGELRAGVLDRLLSAAPRTWRYVVGTFQVKIPVATSDRVLATDERTLAVMKWRLQHISPASRWYPVLQRYLSYLSARITGLGGDPDAIPAAVTGAPGAVVEGKGQRSCSGRVREVIFGCFGDFEGFVIESCIERHIIRSCEKDIGELIMRVHRDRMHITVYLEAGESCRIQRIVVGQCGCEPRSADGCAGPKGCRGQAQCDR